MPNCRRNTARFCSYNCCGNFRKGKSYEGMYGVEKAKKWKEKIGRKSSLRQIRNSFLGHPVKECKCGCGQLIIPQKYRRWGKFQNKPQEYISGHNNPENKFKKKEKIKIICEICEKEFKIKPSLKSKRICCSRKCSAEYKSRFLTGENNHNWLGGISKEPYDEKWTNRFKRAIRKRENQVCMLCGIHREKLNEALSIHHINYDKKLSIPQNCISLCRKCHMLTNKDRKHWQKFFQSSLSEKYDYQYSETGEIILEIKNEA